MKFFGRTFQKGYVIILFACMLPLIMMFSSLVVDLGRGYAQRSKLQNIADAAALAGMTEFEHSGNVHLVSDCPDDATDEPAKFEVDSAADRSIDGNGFDVAGNATVSKKLLKSGNAYYYCVEILDYVPLVLARTFLPDNFLPDGLPVSATAWAIVKPNIGSVNLLSMLTNIGDNQTISEMATIRGAKVGDDRAEKIGGSDGIHYNYSTDSEGNVSVSRTETVDTRSVKTWKYMFIDFQPDIQIDVKNGILKDGEYYFPFGNWDLDTELSASDWKKIKYATVLNASGSGRTTVSRTDLIKRLSTMYGISAAEAETILTTRIENIILFNDLHKVRGKTVAELAAWEEKKMKENGLPANEKALAEYVGNPHLAELVVRNIYGEITVTDPLLVRVESEDINYTHAFTSENIFYASSVRKFTFKIDANNMSSEYRPLVIFYYGPQDLDKKVASEGGKRESQPVTLELNADFKGILFAPNSPVIIKRNGHKIKGFVIGESFLDENGNTINPNKSALYRQIGFTDSDVEFDDFELFGLNEKYGTDLNVILTSEQAKKLT